MDKAVAVYHQITMEVGKGLQAILKKVGVRSEVIFDVMFTFEDLVRHQLQFGKERKFEALEEPSWGKFYAELLSERKLYAEQKNHALLFDTIKMFQPKRVLEVGAGTGCFSIILLRKGAECVSLEINKKLATKIKESGKQFGVTTRSLIADAFHLPFKDSAFTVSFSQGLLEHFEDDKIKKLIDEQLRVAKVCLFSVPSNLYGSKDFGNERLLSKKYWQQRIGGHYTSYCRGKHLLGIVKGEIARERG